jgi:hypothetical protein
MKTTFTKSQILILVALGLIGLTFLVIPIINRSDKYLMPTIAIISWFLFGIYISYLKNKRFVGNDTKIFLLYNPKMVNRFHLIFSLFLIGIIIFISVYKFSFLGLLVPAATFFFINLSWILFPYRGGHLIMIDDTSIYSYETGFIKWDQIKKYTLRDDSMLLEIELKNNEKKSIEYNKFVDFGLVDKELQMRLS